MRYVLSVLFGVIVCTASAKESDVLVLTDNDFDNKLQALENTLVMFYAPWCGHCKKLKPEFDKAAELLVNDDPPISLAKVDCTEEGKETCSKFSVSGYPTLKIFKNGEMSTDYNGPREANGIVKYMRSQVGPASKELKTVADFEAFISKEDTGVVAFLSESSNIEKSFTKITSKLKEKCRFGYTTDKKIIESSKQKEDTVVLYRPKHLSNKFEPDNVVYTGEIEDLEDFIRKEYHGLVGVRTQDSSKDFKQPIVIAYYGVDYKKNPKGTNYWRNRILKSALPYKNDFTFAISSKDEFQYEMNEYGIDYTPSDKPIITAKNQEGKKFIMPEEFSIDNFGTFLENLKSGKLEPFLKSEQIPAHQEGPVQVAVGLNFDEVVNKNGQDTLVEFYAPWCGHCKKLTPIYDELALKLKKEKVSIIKMDATANDVPSNFDVRGFPTLYWLPRDSKSSPVRYEGGRELEDFVKYIAKHATDELDGWDRNGVEKSARVEL